MSSQASVLENTQERMKAAPRTYEIKQKSKPATRKKIIKSTKTSNKAVKRPALDKLVEPMAKRTAKTITNCGYVNASTKNVEKESTKVTISKEKMLILANHCSRNVKNFKSENKKSASNSQLKIIASLVDSIINDMEKKNQTFTKPQIRHVNPVVKKAVTPKKTNPVVKHVTWTEADLEKFGFDFFAGYKSCNSNEKLNDITSSETLRTAMLNATNIADCPLQLAVISGSVETLPNQRCSSSTTRKEPQYLETSGNEFFSSSFSSNSSRITNVSSHGTNTTKLNSVADVGLCPLRLALETEQSIVAIRPDTPRSTSTPRKGQQTLENSWTEFNTSFSTNSSSINDLSCLNSSGGTNHSSVKDVAQCPLQLALEAVEWPLETQFVTPGSISTPRQRQQTLEISWSEFNISFSSNSCSINDLSIRSATGG